MRVANVSGRLNLVRDDTYVDVGLASANRFGPDPQGVFDRWDDFRQWTDRLDQPGEPAEDLALGPPVPRPRQVFAIGLNYRDHAAEAGRDLPDSPPVFTKFPTCLAGPYDPVVLPSDAVDFEVELVVVIGRRAHEVPESSGWSHIAGLMVGQDLSERRVQLAGPVPQFSLGKSFPGFGPVGPVLVTPDEFPDPDDLELGCGIEGGETMQKGRTRDLLFAVPELIARLSAVCPLLPGDLIFTGTPAGVGMARNPPRFLAPGEVLVSHVHGIGELRNPLRST